MKEKNILKVIKDIQKNVPYADIVVVNDWSSDSTKEIVEKRLKAMYVTDYVIKQDLQNGTIILEIPEDEKKGLTFYPVSTMEEVLDIVF